MNEELFGFDIYSSDLLGADKVKWVNGDRPPLLLGLDLDAGNLKFSLDVWRGAKLAKQQLNKDGGILGRRVKLVETDDKSKVDILMSPNGLSGLTSGSSGKGFAFENKFARNYQKSFGARPTGASAYSYDSVNLLGSTITASTETFDYTGEIDLWSVPQDGQYSIVAAGAQGGETQKFGGPGGLGAVISGTFDFITGEELSILVGEMGDPNYEHGAGGGGGSFVVTSLSDPWVVAGGGGGSGPGYGGYDASLTTSGGDSISAGGTNGSGGTIGADSKWYGGAGGGGITGNGQSHYYKSSTTELVAQGGFAYGFGGNGGIASSPGTGSSGGFGGGGAGGGNSDYDSKDQSAGGGGGGGGGYSGGAGADTEGQEQGGGGGGSFISSLAANPSLAVGNEGNGSVVITQLNTGATSNGTSIRTFLGRPVSYELTLRPRTSKKGSVQLGRIAIDSVTGAPYSFA